MSKPFLKWAGGKHKLVPFIEHNLPTKSRKRLIEPFAGSAAVSLALEFESYLLNDANRDLIDLFTALKTDGAEFVGYARSFFTPDNNTDIRFYELRDRFNQSQDAHERAALFVYLNRHAFNGLCRYNSKGGFNVPFGKYAAPYFPETEDTVYCDPPYVPLSETASFTAYAQGGFGKDDQIRLSHTAKKAAAPSQGVLISNHDTEFTREIYREAVVKTLQVQRNIAAKGSSRKKVGELLAIYE